MQKGSLRNILLFAAVGVGALLVCVVPYTATYRNARYARLSLEEQLKTQNDHINDPIFLYHLGRKLNDQQRFTQALPITERAVGLDPESAPSRDEWTRSLLGTGQVSGAFGQLKQYLGTHPDSSEAHFLMAKFYLTQQNLPPARRALEETVKRDPKQAEAWSMLGNVRIKVGEYGAAREALETALRLRPNEARDHLQLAVLLTATETARARQEFARSVELAPKDALCHRQYSRFLLDTSDPAGAEREARSAFALDSQDMFTAVLIGRSLLAQGKGREAVPFLEEAARISPTEPVPVETLCRVYRQIGDTIKAAECETKYLALVKGAEARRHLEDRTITAPGDREAHARFALELAKVGDVNGVLRQHALATKSVPDNTRVLVATARDLNQAGHSAEALPLIRRAMDRAHSSPEAIETLGDALVGVGRLHEAAIHYESIRDWKAGERARYKKRLQEAAAKIAASNAPAEKLLRAAQAANNSSDQQRLLAQALEQEPDNTRCLRMLARLQFRAGQHEEAQKSAERLAAISPEDGVAHSLLALILLEKAGSGALSPDVEKAIDYHIQAGTPDLSVTPTLLYASGLLAMKRGNASLAVESFERAIRLDPKGLAAYQKLAEAKTVKGDMAGAKKAMEAFERQRRSLSASP